MANGLIVDLFAGGGGASVGVEAAFGRPIDIAINHDHVALAVHRENHPQTRHLEADVWEVKPAEVTEGRSVDALWASPDCRFFSRAKGGKPVTKRVRSLANIVIRWAGTVRPRVIFVENVQEFEQWGPLNANNKPIKSLAGSDFEAWVRELRRLGYQVEWRALDASAYGAPTRRVRLFIVARCDGQPIQWPDPTHGAGLKPLKSAADCIDWCIPCPSIFLSKDEAKQLGLKCRRPLAEKTMARIAEGIKRYVLESQDPFVVGGDVACSLIQSGWGERKGQRPRTLDIQQPLGVVPAGGSKHALVAAFLAKHYGGVVGQSIEKPASTITAKDHHSLAVAALVKFRGTAKGQPMSDSVREPLPTITAGGIHVGEVRAFLAKYYGCSTGQGLEKPLHTATAKARFGLVVVAGEQYQIADIGMRMLEPCELLRAQFGDFAETYSLAKATSKKDKIRLIGNSVCPHVAFALARANIKLESEVAA